MMKKLLCFCLLIVVVIFGIGCGNDAKESNEQSTKIVDENVIKEQAYSEIKRVLENVPKYEDEVEKTIWYKPWGTDSIPVRDGVYWYAIEKNGKINLYTMLVNYTEDINWVFWDTIIFSTENKNWKYNIKNCFAGQTGGGKGTKIVMSGKYEYFSSNFNDLEKGFLLLVKSSKPIIRFKGEGSHYDYYLTQDDINLFNTGIYLNEQLKKVNYKIK